MPTISLRDAFTRYPLVTIGIILACVVLVVLAYSLFTGGSGNFLSTRSPSLVGHSSSGNNMSCIGCQPQGAGYYCATCNAGSAYSSGQSNSQVGVSSGQPFASINNNSGLCEFGGYDGYSYIRFLGSYNLFDGTAQRAKVWLNLYNVNGVSVNTAPVKIVRSFKGELRMIYLHSVAYSGFMYSRFSTVPPSGYGNSVRLCIQRLEPSGTTSGPVTCSAHVPFPGSLPTCAASTTSSNSASQAPPTLQPQLQTQQDDNLPFSIFGTGN